MDGPLNLLPFMCFVVFLDLCSNHFFNLIKSRDFNKRVGWIIWLNIPSKKEISQIEKSDLSINFTQMLKGRIKVLSENSLDAVAHALIDGVLFFTDLQPIEWKRNHYSNILTKFQGNALTNRIICTVNVVQMETS